MKRKMTLDEAKQHAVRNGAKLVVDGRVFNSKPSAPQWKATGASRKQVNSKA